MIEKKSREKKNPTTKKKVNEKTNKKIQMKQNDAECTF